MGCSDGERVTDVERSKVAGDLLAVIFALRPDDGPLGQAWTLTFATTAMTRAILATIGPLADPTELLETSARAVEAAVRQTQTQHIRGGLTQGVPTLQ